jgi:glutathione S-transferase
LGRKVVAKGASPERNTFHSSSSNLCCITVFQLKHSHSQFDNHWTSSERGDRRFSARPKMSYTITVPQGYGLVTSSRVLERTETNRISSYVMLISLGATPFLATSLAFLAGSMRKAARVPYPNFYPSAAENKENKEAYKYTCAQRSHANYMENMSQFMVSSLVAGLTYPQVTALLGAGWLVSRVLYAYGYIYGKKDKGMSRGMGSGFWLCQGAIWGLCISSALTLL